MRMQAVAVSAFYEKHIGMVRPLGTVHQQVVVAAQIAREYNDLLPYLQLDEGGPDDVTTVEKPRCNALGKLHIFLFLYGREMGECQFDIVHVIEWFGRGMHRELVAVGPLGIFHLYLGAVAQNDLGYLERGPRADYLSSETHFHQAWQPTGVVHVAVGEQHHINGLHIHRQILPVELAQGFHPLKHAAVHHHSEVLRFDEVFGASYRSSGSEKMHCYLFHGRMLFAEFAHFVHHAVHPRNGKPYAIHRIGSHLQVAAEYDAVCQQQLFLALFEGGEARDRVQTRSVYAFLEAAMARVVPR